MSASSSVCLLLSLGVTAATLVIIIGGLLHTQQPAGKPPSRSNCVRLEARAVRAEV